MKITLAPPAIMRDKGAPSHFLTTYLINDFLAVDAGSLGFLDDLTLQEGIQHVFLSHTHLDHLASLPIFLENVIEEVGGREPVTIYGPAPVLECLQKDLFNDRLWPDFIGLSRKGTPFLQLAALQPGTPLTRAGLRITPVLVNHVVPTCGFIVEDDAAAVVIAGDTGPTQEIWDRANALPHLKAVFLEATFPQAMSRLAEVARHLTPATFALEVAKLHRPVPVIAVHLKARFQAQLIAELTALSLANLQIARYGQPYSF